MKTKYKKFIKDYYKYLIDKGEIKVHNNSLILKKNLKKIINDITRDAQNINIRS